MSNSKLSRKSRTIRVTFSVPESLWKKVQNLAKLEGDSSASRELRKAIELYSEYKIRKMRDAGLESHP